MHRFFVSADQIPNITGSDAHQIKDVLRMKPGDELELLDGSGKVYKARIQKMQKGTVSCEILASSSHPQISKVNITIAQCLPKSKKMDLIIQKSTELGAARIIPALSERSIAKADKLERWQRIAKEASEQCGRSSLPEISPLHRFDDVLKLKSEYDLALIPWELETSNSIKKVLANKQTNGPTNLLLLIGPEGGFSKKEVDAAINAGFIPVSLGSRILRTETVALAVLSMLSYEYDL